MAVFVAGCGHQVTPDRAGSTNGLFPGYVQFKFRTQYPMDFTNTTYVIAFNTSGTGGSPHLGNVLSTNYADFSWEVAVGGGQATPVLYQIIPQPSGGFIPSPISPNPSAFQLVTNSNGQNTEFTLTIARNTFNAGLQPSPTATPTATPTPTPSPTPTATPVGATPSPTPSPTPVPTPTPLYSTTWYVNFFTATGNVGVQQTIPTWIDSMSPNGYNDTTYSSGALDVTTAFDMTLPAVVGVPVTPQSAQIISVEVLNAP